MINWNKKSDNLIVPKKSFKKVLGQVAEMVMGRRLAKVNLLECDTLKTHGLVSGVNVLK